MNEAIYNQPLVLFLGAGASSFLGKKTTVQFFDWLKSDPEFANIYPILSAVEHHIKPSNEVSNPDIEAVLDFLENLVSAGKLFQDFGGEELLRESKELEKTKNVPHLCPIPAIYSWDENIRICNQIKDLVVKHYSEIDGQKAYELYGPVLQLSNFKRFQPLPVFTTNYDLAIGKAHEIESTARMMIDGFSWFSSTIPKWSRAEYDDYETITNNEVILFKLHGSVDWVRTPSGAIQRVEGKQRDPGKLKTIIAYPSRLKREIHEEPFRTNYDYLLACLIHAKLCVVIGFSFRDQEIVEELRQAMGVNEKLELMIFDPRAKAIKSHLEGKLGFEFEAELIKKHFTPRTAESLAKKIKARIKR